MISVRLLGTGSALPEHVHATEDLVARAMPARDPAAMRARIGIDTRCWVGPETKASALGAKALAQAIEGSPVDARDLKRVIFVTSTGGDGENPATANGVLEALGLDDTCDAFDLNNACAGFLTAFDVAARSVATGLGPIAIVTVETWSRYLSPENPRPYVIFGDAAAAVVLGQGRAEEGVIASVLRNNSALRGQLTIGRAKPGEPLPLAEIRTTNDAITESALAAITKSACEVLASAHLTMGDVAWFLPHQPNGAMTKAIAEALGVDEARMVPVVDKIGSVGAAAVPFSLDRLMRTRPVRAGDRILMSAVGAGTAYGSILYRVGQDPS